MKRLNNKGFAHLEIAIAVVVLVLIGGAGLYVWDSKQKAKSDIDTSLPFDEDPAPAKPAKETEEGTLVDMLVLAGGAYFPTYQFKSAEPDLCGASHWHAKEQKVYGLNSKDSADVISMTDPLPGECGFGKVDNVPRESITITSTQQQALLEYTIE